MKKVSIFAFLALGVLLVSGATTPANASTCISFTNFCDKITVNASSDGTVYGMWDWACDGVDATNILGTQRPFYMGTRPAYSTGTAYTYTFWFLFSEPGRLLYENGSQALPPLPPANWANLEQKEGDDARYVRPIPPADWR